MFIRKYEKKDWNKICDIFLNAKPDELKNSISRDSILPLTDDTGLLKSFNESVIYVAELEGCVVGYAGYCGNLVSFLFVDPRYYKIGIGTELLKKVMSEMTESAWLRVAKLNSNAHKLYSKHGFKNVDEFEGKYNGVEIEVQIMALNPELEAWKHT